MRIYYESRLAKVDLPDDVARDLDETVDELTEAAEPSAIDRARSRWAQVEAIVGADARVEAVARDIVEHWERRRADEPGKAMIVGMSRRICVALYERIAALRPDWHDPDPRQGAIKVVMTGSAADPPAYQPHLLSRDAMREVKARARDIEDPLQLVIVRDMWLTGFDAPPVHTMYVDKPMRGVGLMQAIARVNRTFRGKAGGLIVDYIGIAQNLRDALADYSPTDQEQAGVPIEQVVALLREKHDIVVAILHGHPWNTDPYASGSERLDQIQRAMDFLLADEDRKTRFLDQVLALGRAFALAGTRDEAMALRDDVRFFADVRTALLKLEKEGESGRGTGSAALDAAIGQLVSQAVASEGVVDVFAAAGMERPEISVLSDEFLEGLKLTEKPNLQLALLRRLLDDRIRTMRRQNVVESRRLSEMLEEAIRRYQNRALTTAEIIAELVALAKELRESEHRGEALGLRQDEVAFYDAIRQNDSAVLQLGDETLKTIAQQLVVAVRESATIDWDVKETVRAAMRAKVRRLLNRYGYPPDSQEQAVKLVIEQAELLARAA